MRTKDSKPEVKNGTKLPFEDVEGLRAQLRQTGTREIILVSNSMAPLLPTGAVAKIAPVKLDDLQMRDIIVFWSEGILVCHCFWEQSTLPGVDGERMFVTKGISSLRFDYPVRESELVGKVVSHQISATAFYFYFLLGKLKSKFIRS